MAWHGGAGDGCGGRKGAGSCVVPRTARLAARPAAPLPAPLTLPSRPPARPCQRQNDAHAAGWALEVAEPHCPNRRTRGSRPTPCPSRCRIGTRCCQTSSPVVGGRVQRRRGCSREVGAAVLRRRGRGGGRRGVLARPGGSRPACLGPPCCCRSCRQVRRAAGAQWDPDHGLRVGGARAGWVPCPGLGPLPGSASVARTPFIAPSCRCPPRAELDAGAAKGSGGAGGAGHLRSGRQGRDHVAGRAKGHEGRGPLSAQRAPHDSPRH